MVAVTVSFCSCVKNDTSISNPDSNISQSTTDSENLSNSDNSPNTVVSETESSNEEIASNKLIENIDVSTVIESLPIKEKDVSEFLETSEWFYSTKTVWPNTEAPIISTTENSIEISGIFAENFPNINNHIPLSEIIYPCDGKFIYSNYFHNEYSCKTLINMTSSMQKNYSELEYPVVALRKVGNGKYYDVRKYRYGGYLYSFYDMFFDASEGKYTTDDETYITFIGGVYVENILDYADFSSIKIGSTIQDVEQIDSAVAMYMLCDKYNEMEDAFSSNDLMLKYKKDKAYSLHLLTDGLLTIHYDKKNGEYIVSDIVFSEDFIYESPYIEECFGNSYPKQFKILPQDYPPVS